MIALKQLTKFLNTYLQANRFNEKRINGLVLGGNKAVKRIAFSVSLSKKLITEAVKKNCELIIVHHGPKPGQLKTDPWARFLKILTSKKIALIAYHLPLDAHSKIGNNIGLLRFLKLQPKKRFNFVGPVPVGFVGEYKQAKSQDQFVKMIRGENLRLKPHLNGPKKIKRIAMISGRGMPFVEQVVAEQADTFITGEAEPTDSTLAKKLKINIITLGHDFSEQFGIKLLKNLTTEKFKTEGWFIN